MQSVQAVIHRSQLQKAVTRPVHRGTAHVIGQGARSSLSTGLDYLGTFVSDAQDRVATVLRRGAILVAPPRSLALRAPDWACVPQRVPGRERICTSAAALERLLRSAARRVAPWAVAAVVITGAGGLGVVAGLELARDDDVRPVRPPAGEPAPRLVKVSVVVPPPAAKPLPHRPDFSVVDELSAVPAPDPDGAAERSAPDRVREVGEPGGTARAEAEREETPATGAVASFDEVVPAPAPRAHPRPPAREEQRPVTRASLTSSAPAKVVETPSPAATAKSGKFGDAVAAARQELQRGKVYAARRLLRPGAWANDAASIRLLAQTYDPKVLGPLNESKKANVATAKTLYSRAQRAQSGER